MVVIGMVNRTQNILAGVGRGMDGQSTRMLLTSITNNINKARMKEQMKAVLR